MIKTTKSTIYLVLKILAMFTFVASIWAVVIGYVIYFKVPVVGAVISIVGLLIVNLIIAIIAINTVAKPLFLLKEVMVESLETDHMVVLKNRTKDVIGEVITSYNKLCKNMNDKSFEMSALYEELYASEETLQSQFDELLENKKLIETSEKRYRSLFELTSEGLFDMDEEYNMKYYTKDWYKDIGVDVSNPNLDEWTKFVLPADLKRFDSNLERHLEKGIEHYTNEYRIQKTDGDIRWIRAIAKASFDDKGQFEMMAGVHRDITNEKRHEEAILEMAYTDSLTGLGNRRKFENLISEAMKNIDQFGIMYMDIDNFKYINDTYGHPFGDQVICKVARRLKSIVGRGNQLCRLSGDEFGIISIVSRSREDIEQYVNQLIEQLNVPYVLNGITLSVNVTIGIAIYPEHGSSFGDLLVSADVALHDSKETLKNSFRFFEEEIRVKTVRKGNIETHLVKSLEKEELFVVYQPVVDLKTKQIKGFEALVRWHDTEFGAIYPDEFIPIAEKIGFIHPLGEFVIEKSIEFGSRLFEASGSYYVINVNVSVLQLQTENFNEMIKNMLIKYQYPAECLNIEITESLALEHDKKILATLAEIKRSGIKISLDDFGTGYSSLNNLMNLSLSQMKIDRSLISKATSLPEVYKLINGVVEFAHTLELTVVAEGIETVMMEELVSNMNVDYSQGYLYAKPLIEEDAFNMIMNQVK